MGKEKQSGNIQLIEGWAFEKTNYILFIIGVLLIITGYFVMANGTVNSFQSLTPVSYTHLTLPTNREV